MRNNYFIYLLMVFLMVIFCEFLIIFLIDVIEINDLLEGVWEFVFSKVILFDIMIIYDSKIN